MKKTALITGITGQDGSYLAEFLIEKGYEVHGIIRRSSSFNTERIEHLYIEELIRDLHSDRKVSLHYGDMTDSTNLIRLIQEIKPDEIYNLAAQSHVRISFDVPEYTIKTNALGVFVPEALAIGSSPAMLKLTFTLSLNVSLAVTIGKTPPMP